MNQSGLITGTTTVLKLPSESPVLLTLKPSVLTAIMDGKFTDSHSSVADFCLARSVGSDCDQLDSLTSDDLDESSETVGEEATVVDNYVDSSSMPPFRSPDPFRSFTEAAPNDDGHPLDRKTLEAVVYVSIDQCLLATRYIQVLSSDTTCKSNRLRYLLGYLCCFDANNKTQITATAFMRSETNVSYRFMWSVALPLLYGRHLRRVTCVLTDGDEKNYTNVDHAITSSVLGCATVTKRRRCIWHLVTNQFAKVYGRYTGDDNNTGSTVQRWIIHACFKAESADEFTSLWTSMESWLEARLQQGLIKDFMHSVLVEFISSVFAER